MDFDDADKLISAWGMWERGFSAGIALAIQTAETLGREESVQRREVLIRLSDSLRQAKNRYAPGPQEHPLKHQPAIGREPEDPMRTTP
jgi:hypothetical protein